MRRHAIVVAALLLLVAPARAVELTKNEERFVRDLVDALADESEDVRQASEEALVRMGEKAAAWIAPNARRVKVEAIDAMKRVLIRIGYPAYRQIRALEKVPSGRVGDALVEVLHALDGKGGDGGFGAVDPEVDAKVKELLDRLPKDRFMPDDPAVLELVALGRAALPSLVKELGGSTRVARGFRPGAAAAAMGRLCTKEDTPLLARLLDEGSLRVASVMVDVNDPEAVPALVRALQAGRLSYEVAQALRHFRDDRTRVPVLRFLEEHGAAYPPGTMVLFDLVVEMDMREAVPALTAIAKAGGDDSQRNARIVNACRALVQLGDAAGLPPLIAALTLGGSDDWLVGWAGRTLNRVTGQDHWKEGGDGADARKRYEEWYESVRENLVWNETSRTFGVRE